MKSPPRLWLPSKTSGKRISSRSRCVTPLLSGGAAKTTRPVVRERLLRAQGRTGHWGDDVKTFHCTHCQHLVFFENIRCLNCSHALAYLPDRNLMGAIEKEPAYRLCA